jgi:hypothetical protein
MAENYQEKIKKLTCGGESGIRTHGTLPRTLDFESSAFDQLSHLSMYRLFISLPSILKEFLQ